MDDMDDGPGDEVASVNASEGAHLQNKENEYLLKPESCNKLESQEMAIPESNSPDGSFQILADMLEGKNINTIVSPLDASEHPCTSFQNVDDAGVMVEELTVRKYNSSNLAIVGTSNNRERMQTRHNRWQHLYQLAGGTVSGSSRGDRENGKTKSSGWEDVGDMSVHGFVAQKPLNDDHNVVMEPWTNSENNGVSSNMLSHGHIRTKILSKSGFSEFFVKTTLKGKGIVCRGPPHDAFKHSRDLKNTEAAFGTAMHSNASPMAAGAITGASNVLPKAVGATMVALNASLNLGAKVGVPSSCRLSGSRPGSSDYEVSLREWLKARGHKVNKVECLYIFRQIVDLVEYSHTQGITLLDLRPSSFKLLRSNQVKYLGSVSQKETLQSVTDQNIPQLENYSHRRRPAEEEVFLPGVILSKKPKFNNNMSFDRRWPLFPSRSSIKVETVSESDINTTTIQHSSNDMKEHHTSIGYGTQSKSSSPLVSNTLQQHLSSVTERSEEKWYASPEELNEGFLGCFDSETAHAAAMSDLRHRILPPTFLSENPKEAGFCLWLLHPEPLSRPTTREIRQSEVINGLQEVCAEELSLSIDQDDSESELLLHFLISLEEQKQNHASKLMEEIGCLEADTAEVDRRLCLKNPLVRTCLQKNSINTRENKCLNTQPSSAEPHLSPVLGANERRLMRNFSQLERAYFSMRSEVQLPDTDATTRQDKDLLKNRENQYFAQKEGVQNPTDPLGSFFDGLCKYARYSKFEVRGVLRTGDFNNSANVICSLSFDRDEDHFAAAGISKKIKIFEFNSLFNDSVDIHYPAVEMSNRSKLSCICWNNYIKNFLASADYDGVVKIWDASTGQTVSHYIEHEKRAWSVDFSRVHPTKLASGSDDYSVKLWSINEALFLFTIL
ncbi:hypothetical protein Patl1_17568 [Pistacia atlantica]|uniref:Uncharacterized protein n=1 Tax=Pistacia atlantica TaxID=434234 RepID=A0ACC1BX37_9ROSI|nr:hypothetical protein Patl1_17568 [Pistacia atlantica]